MVLACWSNGRGEYKRLLKLLNPPNPKLPLPEVMGSWVCPAVIAIFVNKDSKSLLGEVSGKRAVEADRVGLIVKFWFWSMVPVYHKNIEESLQSAQMDDENRRPGFRKEGSHDRMKLFKWDPGLVVIKKVSRQPCNAVRVTANAKKQCQTCSSHRQARDQQKIIVYLSCPKYWRHWAGIQLEQNHGAVVVWLCIGQFGKGWDPKSDHSSAVQWDWSPGACTHVRHSSSKSGRMVLQSLSYLKNRIINLN